MIQELLPQIFDLVWMGILVVDAETRVVFWNRWLEQHTGKMSQDVLGKSLLEIYPNLDKPQFRRSVKSVFTFGNFAFFSQPFHGALIPIANKGSTRNEYPNMQQNARMGPLRKDGKVAYAFISIEDVTERVHYESRLAELSKHDWLTGLFNRKSFDEKIREEVLRAQRYKSPLSLLIIDIDHFKQVNDNYGHQVGDLVLKNVAGICAARVRNVDFMARYGGEEFCIIMPETPQDDAFIQADRLRRAVKTLDLRESSIHVQVTISIGLSTFVDGDSEEKLISRADQAMYQAKRNGRDRVEMLG